MTTIGVVLVMFLATFVQCTFGFGNALVAMPLLAFFVPLHFASPLVALVSMTVTLGIVAADWRHMEFGTAVRMVAGAVLGIPIGLWLLASADERLVKGLLALVILSFAVFSLSHPRPLYLKNDAWGYSFGWVAGILGGAYNTHGPPLIIYGFLRHWTPQQFRATLQGYFLLAGSLVLTAHALAGFWTKAVFRHYLFCLPLAGVAFASGHFLSRRFSQERYRRFVHYAILCLAVSLLVNVLTAPEPANGDSLNPGRAWGDLPEKPGKNPALFPVLAISGPLTIAEGQHYTQPEILVRFEDSFASRLSPADPEHGDGS